MTEKKQVTKMTYSIIPNDFLANCIGNVEVLKRENGLNTAASNSLKGLSKKSTYNNQIATDQCIYWIPQIKAIDRKTQTVSFYTYDRDINNMGNCDDVIIETDQHKTKERTNESNTSNLISEIDFKENIALSEKNMCDTTPTTKKMDKRDIETDTKIENHQHPEHLLFVNEDLSYTKSEICTIIKKLKGHDKIVNTVDTEMNDDCTYNSIISAKNDFQHDKQKIDADIHTNSIPNTIRHSKYQKKTSSVVTSPNKNVSTESKIIKKRYIKKGGNTDFKYYNRIEKSYRTPLFWTMKWIRGIEISGRGKWITKACMCKNNRKNNKETFSTCINPWHYE